MKKKIFKSREKNLQKKLQQKKDSEYSWEGKIIKRRKGEELKPGGRKKSQ